MWPAPRQTLSATTPSLQPRSATRARLQSATIGLLLGSAGDPHGQVYVEITTETASSVQSQGSITSPRPNPSLLPEPAWTSITWAASDPAPFSGPGNQFVFGGVPWAGGTVLA